MGDIKVGDLVYDEQGWPCTVKYCSSVAFGRTCYRIDFSDGESITCDAEHLWQVHDRWARKNPKVRTTEELKENCVLSIKRGWNETRYRVDVAMPLQGSESDVCIDPYLLGYWLGDGTSSSANITIYGKDLSSLKKKYGALANYLEFGAEKTTLLTAILVVVTMQIRNMNAKHALR